MFGVWVGRGQKSASDYFLGGRNIAWWAVLLSIVATETSTVTFLSVPGKAFVEGGDLRFLQLTFGYMVGRLAVVALLLPAYFRGERFTAYEVLGQRFGSITRQSASLLFIFTRNAADGLRLFLTAIVLRSALEFDLTLCIVIIGLTTIAYTFFGGVKSVVWNDCVQFLVYMVGAVIALFVLGGKLPGGWESIGQFALENDKWRLLDFDFSLTTPTITFWSGLVGGAFLSFATHGADQLMVQRYLTARSQRGAAVALLLSGPVVCAQFALFLLIGVGLATFYGTSELRGDEAFITFIVNQMGVGLTGLILAAIFAAAMSTLSSSLNSSASALVSDLAVPWLGLDSSSDRALWLGRAATVVFGFVQMGVAIGADRLAVEQSVVDGVLGIAGFTTGLVLGIYLLGLASQRTPEWAALAGFGCGLVTVSYVAFGTNVSWPWYTAIGSLTTASSGWLLGWGKSWFQTTS